MPDKRYKRDKKTGLLTGSKARYETPDDFMVAVDEFFDNPPMRKIYYKHDMYEVPNITMGALCRHLGYHEKYIYQLPSVRKEEEREQWEDAIYSINRRMIEHWQLYGQHGNHSFAQYMLACLGFRPEEKQEESKPLQIEFVDAMKPDADTTD